MGPAAVKGGLTRRQLLALTVGAPLAAAGAVALHAISQRREGKPPLPPGRIVGPDVARGHRLRPGGEPPRRPETFRAVDVAIVGGGVAGLAAAWRLDHAGCAEFEVLELETELGGTSRSGRSDVTAYPWGAHYTVLPGREHRAMVRLLQEVGAVTGFDADGEPLGAEEILCRDPQERIFMDGRWHEGVVPIAGASRDDERDFSAFHEHVRHWASWRDPRGRRAFDLPLVTSSRETDAVALDAIPFSRYLDDLGLRSPRLRWYLDYGCRDDYGLRLHETSAWAGLFYFASRLRRPDGPPQPLLVWPEGNGRLVDHMSRRAAARVRPGWMATRVAREGGGVEIWAEDASGARAGWRAKRAILAVPPRIAWRLLAEKAPPWVDALDHTPWVVANLHLSRRPASGAPPAWDNVLYDSPALGYVDAAHQTDASSGATVLTWYHALCDRLPAASRHELLAADRDSLAEHVLSDLETAHPDLRALVTRLDLMLWGHGMVRPRPGVVTSLDRAAARAPAGAVHFAHTDLSGVALFEEAFDHGLRAAEEVLVALGLPPGESWAARGE
jgi:protoporphyrinogen oxidase